MGRPKLKNPRKNYVFRFSEEVIYLLSQLAEKEHRTLSNMLEKLIWDEAEANGITVTDEEVNEYLERLAA